MWLSAFAFLGTVGLTFVTVVLAVAFARRNRKLATRFAGAAVIIIAVYGLILIGASLSAPAHILAAGQEKHICEIDCHLAYSVVNAQRAADGEFVVTVRMRFDETTTSPRRDNSPLYPGARHIALIDAQGKTYQPVRKTGLDAHLRPGESTLAALTFRIPANVQPVRLRFEDADPIKRLLIGSETAPLHKRVEFSLS